MMNMPNHCSNIIALPAALALEAIFRLLMLFSAAVTVGCFAGDKLAQHRTAVLVLALALAVIKLGSMEISHPSFKNLVSQLCP